MSKVDDAMRQFTDFRFWFRHYVNFTPEDLHIYGAIQAKLEIAVYDAMIEEYEQMEEARTVILATLELRIQRMESQP